MTLEFLLDYGLFLAKIATVVIAIIAILVIAKSVGGKSSAIKGELEITNLSEHHKQTIEQLEHHLHDDAFIKARDKAERKREKKVKSRGKEVKKAAKEVSLIASVNHTYSFLILTAALMRKKWLHYVKR